MPTLSLSISALQCAEECDVFLTIITLSMIDSVTPHTAESVCAECRKETAIKYTNGDSFFGPRLRSINHLELGYSKVITNPFTIFLELLYVFYKKIRALISRIIAWMFPRNCDVMYGVNLDSAVVGKLTFAARDELDKPVHGMKIELWARTRLLRQWRKLSEGYSDRDGKFYLPFEVRAVRNIRMAKKVQVEISEITSVFHDPQKEQPTRSNYTVFRTITINKSEFIGMEYSVNTVRLPFWEYRTDAPTPRVVIKDHDKDAPEYYTQGRLDALIQQVIPIELTKLKHLERIDAEKKGIVKDKLTIAKIQSDYPQNLTVCIEKKLPGYTRSDAWFGERMMNGMNKGCFVPDAENPEHFWMHYFGICNYDHNDEYALPDAAVKYELTAKDLPTPIEIRLTGRLNIHNTNKWQEHVFTPADGEQWLAAKRVVRTCGAVSTEIDEHFTGTHINTEQYSIAAFRNLRQNPVAWLLLPHLKEASLINHSADSLIIQGYLPTATALTQKGILARTRDILGVQDWCGWEPMKAISKAHNYAKAEQLFWDIVGKYVEGFFVEHEKQIKKYWYEIKAFSDDLVKHSVPVFMPNEQLSNLQDKERAQAERRKAYYSQLYSFNYDLPRKEINGVRKAVSPITEAENFEKAAQEDFERLKAACRYIIMTATFLHTWINEHQYDDLGEVMYSCGGLRFGTHERGVIAPESDLSIAPDLTRATQMLWFTNLLSRTEYGFITRNEEEDIPPLLIELLKEKEAEFAALGVDINAIESRTNI